MLVTKHAWRPARSFAAKVAGAARFEFRGKVCDPFAAPERVTVAEAFDRLAKIDLLATLDGGGAPDREALAYRAADYAVRAAKRGDLG